MFQSTHPRGVRLQVSHFAPQVPRFQSTHPRGVRRCSMMSPDVSVVFQSTHPRGVRRTGLQKKAGPKKFQSTHPRGVRPSTSCSGPVLPGFNPRTRVGCDVFRVHIGTRVIVSIHAPAWGATQHRQTCTAVSGFQSTHPRGVRQKVDEDSPVLITGVSIHAPAWGATRFGISDSDNDIQFQSTHPRGVRPTSGRRPGWLARFQSTHPRGVRRLMEPTGFTKVLVSIHAPAWGATITDCIQCWIQSRFNPRTRVGCDNPYRIYYAVLCPVSIHAPAWGATPSKIQCLRLDHCFNPRTRVGCDAVVK